MRRLPKWFLLVILAVSMSGLLWQLCRPARRIYWPGTPEYAAHVASLRVSPEEAATRIPPAIPVHSGSMFMVDRWYVYPYGTPLKGGRKLAGIYISGDSGAVELRDSPIIIDWGRSSLPSNPWTSVVPLSTKTAPSTAPWAPQRGQE